MAADPGDLARAITSAVKWSGSTPAGHEAARCGNQDKDIPALTPSLPDNQAALG